MQSRRDPLAVDVDPLDAVLAATVPDIDPAAADLDAVLDPAARRPAPEPARESTGTFAGDTAAELSALEQGIKDRKAAEKARFRAATDSEYWVAVCFTSRAEKEAFLAAAGLLEHGDKYLDGRVVAAVTRAVDPDDPGDSLAADMDAVLTER